MHGQAPTAGYRLQVTGDRKQQTAAPSSVGPITCHPSPVTCHLPLPSPVTTIGFVFLPRFHAEVEARLLRLEGRPIVIHRRGRIVSLGEAAEEAGLKVGMRLAQAQAIFPNAEFIALVEDRYQPFWKEVLDICVAHVGAVEPLKPGEVFVDLGNWGQAAIFPPPPPSRAGDGGKWCLSPIPALQEAIQERTGLTCRTACGPSKLVARLVGNQGQAAIFPPPPPSRAGDGGKWCLSLISSFLDPLPITQLWTLDPKTIEHLQALGMTTIGLLRRIPHARLAEHFGREARRLHDLARGIDHSPVEPLYPPREIVVRQTLPGGADNPEALDRCLRELVQKVARELQQRQDACSRVSLRVTTEEGHPHLSPLGRGAGGEGYEAKMPPSQFSSLRLRNPSSEEGDLLRACRVLLRRLRISAPISAIALKVSECRRDSGRQLSLFHDNRALTRKRRRTSKALEVIRECFGNDIAILGAEIELPRRERVLAAISAG